MKHSLHVEDLMTRDVCACRSDATFDQAARLMWEEDVGCLPVIGVEERVVGMITDRDLCMGAYTRGASFSALRVADSMNPAPVTCHPRDSIESATSLMSRHQLHRLAVVDGLGRLEGMLTLKDLARTSLRRESGEERHALHVAVAETLASVAEPERRASPEQVAERSTNTERPAPAPEAKRASRGKTKV